jgi:hypothetical protein
MTQMTQMTQMKAFSLTYLRSFAEYKVQFLSGKEEVDREWDGIP